MSFPILKNKGNPEELTANASKFTETRSTQTNCAVYAD